MQYTLILERLQILSGVRWEEANDKYFTSASGSFAEQQSNVKMVNFLPGIHFRYEFTPDQIGRLSIAQTLSRPSYFDLVPAVDRADESQSQGNPNLRPARATNIDLRYEYYPDASDAFSAGVYYKKIIDPIEDQFQSVGVLVVTTKGNGDPATVYGFESVISKHFGGLGISANYSYVFSQITSTKTGFNRRCIWGPDTVILPAEEAASIPISSNYQRHTFIRQRSLGDIRQSFI